MSKPKQISTGGNYEAIDNGDGTHTIKDVPIFAEHSVPTGRNKSLDVNYDWLLAAVERAEKRRDEDKYLAPLHIRHHGFQETERAGFFMPTGVRRITYEGNPTWTLFADLIVPDDILERMRRNELPYRSVEIHDLEEPEINSLALLDDEVPFFRFPLLTIKKPGRKAQAKHCNEMEPMLAYAASGRSAAYLYSEESMSEHYEDDKKEEEKEEEKAQDESPELSLADMLEELTRQNMALGEKLDQLIESMGGEEPEEPESEAGPAEESKASAESMAKLSALESVVKKMQSEKDAEKLTRSAMKELSGYALADGVEDQIRKVATESGKGGVEHYVATIKQYAPKEPTESTEQDEFAGLPDEVMEYQAQGPKAFEKAIGHYREYEALRGKIRMNLKSFLSAQFSMGVK